MKAKLMNGLQRLSKALFAPVLILPMVGLLIASGNVLQLLTGYGDGAILTESLLAVFNYLGLVFYVGVTLGLADKKKTEAAFIAVIGYLIFTQAVSQTVPIEDTGVLLGILLGCITAVIHNRYANKEFKGFWQIYGGSRFSFLVLAPILIVLAVLFAMAAPFFQSGLQQLSHWISRNGNIGLFFYGMLERLLIPAGLQHLVTMPMLYTPLGGVTEVGGQVFEGAQSIYLAEMADPTVSILSPSVIWDARGIAKMFGLTGACLAMYHTAKPENKGRAKALLIPAAFATLVTGVTEPIEFSFLVVSPILFGLHAILSGASMVVLNVLEVRAISPTGLIDFLIYNLPLGVEKTNWPMFILVGVLFFLLYYVLFRFFIQIRDIKTIGREEGQQVKLYSKAEYEEKGTVSPSQQKAAIIVAALGGHGNIKTVENCYSRLRIMVEDEGKVDEELLMKQTGASGVVTKGKNIQVVYGLNVTEVRRSVDEYLEQ